MALYLPPAPKQYDALDQSSLRRELLNADRENRKIGSDVDILASRLILQSPNGTRWSITVDNAGTITATSL